MSATLFIIATPIGNLNDISFRAISVLKEVDIILAENILHSKNLLNNFNIANQLESFNEHNEDKKIDYIINKLESGKSIALISDAGTPLINDPGYKLVYQAKNKKIKVSPIPGPCAIITALCASGITSNNFTFYGFLSNKQSSRIKSLQNIIHQTNTSIYYESPKRILATMNDMLNILGADRRVCLAREITKTFETITTDSIANIIKHLQSDAMQQKGEFVIIISAVDKKYNDFDQSKLDNILFILVAEMTTSKAAKIASKITGIEKKYCYKRAIEIKNNNENDAKLL